MQRPAGGCFRVLRLAPDTRGQDAIISGARVGAVRRNGIRMKMCMDLIMMSLSAII